MVERTKEIGVRIALGATRRIVFRQMLSEMMALAAGGVVLGSAGALALTRLIRTMLFGVSATDGVTYVGVGMLLGVVQLRPTFPHGERCRSIRSWRCATNDGYNAMLHCTRSRVHAMVRPVPRPAV